MRFVEWFDPGPHGVWLILTVIVQVTVVILAAAIATRTILRRRPAACHRVWLAALACTLLGPAAVVLAERVGYALPILPWTQAAAAGAEPAMQAPAFADREGTAPADPGRARLETTPLDRVRTVGGEESSSPILPSGDGVAGRLARAEGPEPDMALEPVERVAVEPAPGYRLPDPAPRREPGVRAGRAVVGGCLVLVWATGVMIGLGRLGVGWRRLSRLRASLRPFDASDHGGVLREVRDALGASALPPIATSPAVVNPVAIGVLRPRVVLPEGLAATLTARQLRDVLVHECAHVLRRDALVGVLQRLAAVVYWPHPLIHHMNAQLARAREEVCDNFVLRGGDPCGYARTLLELTERGRPAGPVACAGFGLMGARWTLRDRVAGLLDPRRDVMTKPNRRAAGAAVLTLVAFCVGIAGVRPADPPEAGAQPPGDEVAEATAAAPERIVRGVVVDEEGRPVAGATVRPAWSAKAPEPATTDDDGRFTLAIGGFMLLEEGLVASADGGARLGLGTHVEPQHSGPAEPVRIVLKPSRTVAVHVRDADGQAVADATVEAVGADYRGPATTDASGHAALRIPADAKIYWIIGLKPDVGFDYFENYQARPATEYGPLPDEVTLTLDGAQTARIKAVDSSGRPVPDVEFRPWYVAKPNKIDGANLSGAETVGGRTDEQGIATFAWLPTEVDQGVSFLVSPGAYSCPGPPIYQPASGEVELEARLLRSTRIGGVVRAADGQPAAGILLQAQGRGATNHYGRFYTRTRDDGSYRFEVYPEQSYIIAVLDDHQAARSLTGVVVREGQPREDLDLTLGAGTLLHGQVTQGPEETPAAGERVTLIQQGEQLPDEFISRLGGGETESLVRSAKTDAEGRYQLRVGPGRYELLGPDFRRREGLRIEDEEEVVRDFQIAETVRRRTLTGLAVEPAPPGERPIAEAIIEASPVGRRGLGNRAVADDEGRFRLFVDPDRDQVLYVRDRAGTVAGFTVAPAEASDVQAAATPASRIRGRVVDSRGRPQAGRRVRLRLETGPDSRESGHYFTHAVTDAEGRYNFPGVVVGAFAEVSVSHDEDPRGGGRVEAERLDVRGPDPIDVPDLVVPANGDDDETARATEPEAVRPPFAREVVAAFYRPVTPTRTEVEALVRAIDRDPVTPDLVDRAWLLTRPQFTWFVALDRVRQRVSDADFTRRADEAALAVLGGPADTLTLLRLALVDRPGYDVEALKRLVSREAQAAVAAVPAFQGTVVEVGTGQPIAGALVYTTDALARTTATGAFELGPSGAQRRGLFWVEADGFAMAAYPAPEGGDAPASVRVELLREEPVLGRVVGPDDQPVSEATVRAWFKHFDFHVPRPDDPPQNDSYGFPLEVRTDAEGRFALRGLPPDLAISWYEVRHPEHRTFQGGQVPLTGGAPTTLKLEAGCQVAGVVVDEQGRAIPGALVEIRDSGRRGTLHTSYTADDGRFRFGNVAPGRWMVVIQPQRHAPVFGPVVATEDRAVENQYVVEPGAYISGRVVGPDGEPIARAAVGWVQPVDERGHAVESLELGRMTSTAEDGTFRLGPLAQGEFRLTSVIDDPRRLGQTRARSNQTDVVIRLEPDPRN